MEKTAEIARLVEPTLNGMGYESCACRCRAGTPDVADHGRAERSRDDGRGLRRHQPRDLGPAGCRGSDRHRLSAGGQLAGHRPAADPAEPITSASPASRRSIETRRPVEGRRRFRGTARRARRRRRAVMVGGRDGASAARRDIERAKLVLTDELIAATGRATQLRLVTREGRHGHDLLIRRLELLQVADAVAREKSIERDEVLEAMEQAIQKAGRVQIRPRARHPRRRSTARPARSG